MRNEDIFGMDVKKGMAVVANNKTVYVRLLKTFAASTLHSELADALEAGDTSLAMAKAHALKGVSGNLRIDKVFELVKAIEADLKDGKPVTSNDGLAAELAAAYAKTLESVNMFIENPDLLTTIE